MNKNLDAIARLGCIICRIYYNTFTDAEIHHLREDTGLSLKSDKTLPLCDIHHRLGNYGVAFHAGKEVFEKNYGTQLELWEKTQEILCKRAGSSHTKG